MKNAAVIIMCGGLALLGCVSAGYASGAADSHSSVTSTEGSCPSSVTTSGPITISDGVARVSFTVAAGCAGVEVTLVSYAAPSAAFDESVADQQVLFRAATVTALPGAQLLTVEVPDCFFQVDFAYGPPLPTLGPAGTGNFYGAQDRLILFATGGAGSCSTSTSTTTTSSTTTTTLPVTTAPTTTVPTTTTVATIATTPQTTTSAPPTTAPAPPTTAPQTTTSAPPTTAPQITTSTPPTATVVTTPEVTTSTTVPAGPIVPPSTTTGGPSLPPKQQIAPPPTTRVPPLSYTGARLPVVTAIGFLLLIAGLVLWFLDRLRTPAIDVASSDPVVSAGPRLERRPEYRVLVPGVGTFASLTEADQWLFELRLGRRQPTTYGGRWGVEPAG